VTKITTDAAIAADKLCKRYGDVVALRDLDLHVKLAEVFGFLGPNGAGKSTMIRIMLGFLRPSSGNVRVLGMDSVRDHLEILRHTGYLPGDPAFDAVATGEQALDFLASLSGAEPRRRAEVCERLQLDEATLRRKVRDYSKGTRQKLGIVQALQHDPRLIVMDEPTEGLDPLVQHAFTALLSDLRAEGKTIFLSSHILSEVERVCDRVAIIRKGKLVAVENISTLLAKRSRHVELRFDGHAPDLSDVAGISSIRVAGDTVTCRLSGDVRPLLQRLATLLVRDVTIESAHLEDAFLELYGETEA